MRRLWMIFCFRGGNERGHKRGDTDGEHAAREALDGIDGEIGSVDIVAHITVNLQIDQARSEPGCFAGCALLDPIDAAISVAHNDRFSGARVTSGQRFFHGIDRT